MTSKGRLAAEILATYAEVRWLLRGDDLREVTARLRARRPIPTPTLGPEGIARCARAVVRVLRLLPADPRCLVRSLVLLAVLARRGTETELVIGVLPEPRFAAHAWVEHEGVPLLPAGEAGDGRLTVL